MSLPNVQLGDPHVTAHNQEREAINALQNLEDETFVEGLNATIATQAGGATDAPSGLPPVAGVLVKNLHPRPASGETTDWFLNGFGTGGAGTKTKEVGGGHLGRDAYVGTWTTASTATGTNTGPATEIQPAARSKVIPGLPTTVSCFVEVEDTASDVTVWPQIRFKDAGGTTLLSAGTGLFVIPKGKGERRVFSPTVDAPEGADTAYIEVRHWTAAEMGTGKIKFSCAQVEQSRFFGPYRDGNFPDAWWTGTPNDSPSIAMVERHDRIACFGDSHFGQADGGGYLLPEYVEQQAGVEVYNGGRGGEPSTGIATRAGAQILTLNAANTIPATATAGTLTGGVTPSATWRTTGSWPIPGQLGGVSGTIRINNNVWTFTRDVAGSAVSVPAGTPFIPYGMPHADVWIIMAGNNLPDPALVVRDVAQIVAACRAAGRRFLVMSLYNNANEPEGSAGYAKVMTVNDHHARAYPGHYVDARRHLIDNGLSILGITPTGADTTAISEDRIPPSLMDDDIHLLPETREDVVAPFLVTALRARGLIT